MNLISNVTMSCQYVIMSQLAFLFAEHALEMLEKIRHFQLSDKRLNCLSCIRDK